MTRTIWIVSLYTLALAGVIFLPGCATTRADDALNCEALRPDMPVKFHGGPDGNGGPGYDTPDTIGRLRKANARFTAACP